MKSSATAANNVARAPRWPALLALLSVGGLYLALPDALVIGPRWLLLLIVGGLIVPTVITHLAGNHRINQLLGYVLCGVVTLALCASLTLLIGILPSHRENATQMLQSAGALWLTNVLVFALWYWRLDGGGPHARDARPSHTDGAFLFPQMTMGDEASKIWSPEFVDYLFLAFNTSTAFSPTDAPVLSRWGKVLMMLQSLVSLLIVALLAARAVNVL